MSLSKKIEGNVVLEHMFDGIPSDVRNARKVISYIAGSIEENYLYEITEHWMEVFNERVELIRNFLKERGGCLSEIKREDLYDAIDYGFSIVNMCSILKPYEIGEEFIPEKIYTTNRSKFIIDSNAICPTRKIQL